jgi:hypothetical protein
VPRLQNTERPDRRRRSVNLAAACRCGRLGCDGCALTPRTVYLLAGELAWLADMAEIHIAAIVGHRRPIGATVFASLPEVALGWGSDHPAWLERYAAAADEYEARLQAGHPVIPRALAEEVLLYAAFETVRHEAAPDEAIGPGAQGLPKLTGDYAWARAAEAVGFRAELAVLYDDAAGPLIPLGDRLHPGRWFEPYSAP